MDLSCLNSGGILTFPTNYYSNPPSIWQNLVSGTSNRYPAISITAEGIDMAALANTTVLSDQGWWYIKRPWTAPTIFP
jgi:hypothetical protein